MARIRLGLAAAACVLALDQVVKYAMLELVGIALRPPIEVTGFFNLVMVWNRGISFGLLAEQNQPYALVALSLTIIAVLLAWLMRRPPGLEAAALGLVIGGALGNVVDRLRFGAVADFFDFHLMGYHWPAFNIADSGIFIGVVVLCATSMFMPKKLGKRQ